MKIRLLQSISCSVNGYHGPGDIVDWKDPKEAKSLIAQGVAAAISKKAATAAAKANVETATTD